jgi:hypothetical protein
MRHRDDDLSPFREDPVVKALSAPGTPAELAGEAEAVAAYREAVAAPVPMQRRRSAARVATGGTVAVLVLGLSGGVAAAYTNNLPDSWQKTVYKQFHSIGVPSPKPAKPAPPAALPPTTPAPAPVQSSAPTPAHTVGKSEPHASPSPSATKVTASPSPTASVPVVVPTPTVSTSPTASPTPTSSEPPPAVDRGRLQIQVSAARVSAGAALTVTGTLTDPGGNPIANRHVALIEHIVGEPGRHRVGSGTTSSAGQVTIDSPPAQRNMRLVLRSGRIHSPAQRVVVTPILHVEVPATPVGATALTIVVSVSGALPGDVVVIRGHGDGPGQQASLSSSLQATFTLPVSQSRQLHYRAVVERTRSHAAHSLKFYVPPSGG